MCSTSYRIFVRGGGGGGLRMEGRINHYTLNVQLIKRFHKVTELTTSTTKEHAPDWRVCL